MKYINKPIIVEESFPTPIGTVWNAISNIAQMREWFFENIESFEAEVGFETQFNVKSGTRNFLHFWKLTEVVPNKKIKYNWKYAEYLGNSFVTFELFEDKENTKLRVTAEGMESFPQDIPEFTRESCNDGWNYFIKNRLLEFLTKNNAQ
jgi:uncharacterized protein YndB with AHSA1/START domain